MISKNAKKTKLKPENNRKRIGKSLFFLAIAVFAIFIFRLVWLVTVNHVGSTNLKQNATYNFQSTVSVQAKRGTIYDRYGTAIAVDSSSYTLYVVLDKKQTDVNGNKLYADKSEFDKITTFLNSKLGIDKTLITQQLNNKKASQVQFGTKGSNISLQKMQELQKAADDEGLVGIGFISNVARSYPMSNVGSGFASQFIGTAANDGNTLVGSDGIELAYNSILSGKNGVETYQKDASGHPLPGTTKVIKPVENGSDVYTTLDSRLQEQLETLMDKAASDSGAQQLSATLMTKDGQILATTQRPTYTPATKNTATDQKYFTWNSLLFQTGFEPGSVMKTFLMASALDSNKVDLNATYDRTELKVYDATIKDWDINEHSKFLLPTIVNYADGFMMSSNVGMSRIEQQMGYNTWEQYLKKFKFDMRVRTGLSGEVASSLPAANAVSQVQSAFGQGIAVTQIQLLRGWTTFANNGVMLEPHGISQIVNPNENTSLTVGKEVIGNPVSSSAISKTLQLMEGVDTNATYGTAYTALGDAEDNIPANSPLIQINGNPAAVKTGTAQIAAPGGGYIQGAESNLYSMVAMYPASNPDFIMYMNIKLPTKTWSLHYISRVVNPMLTLAESRKSEIFQTTSVDKAGKVKIADYSNENPGSVTDTLRQEILQPVLVGSTTETGVKIVKQSISSGTSVPANTRILLLTSGSPLMPDMYSWTKEQVDQVAKWYNLKVTYSGSGSSVTKQSVTAASSIKKGQSLTITLGN
ncbi:penicillin-binding protein [Lactococcus fujiensis JCM 16395]|uniref:Penicillin-binding protein n=2 Tax=Lactococcus fujiensis TaxID=610251 RepID=A0A2A5RIR0_9LACT|nr:penicillin-binding protein [Lactococcus fujiensis JCM 16395]